jgi:hypothetical protein
MCNMSNTKIDQRALGNEKYEYVSTIKENRIRVGPFQ